MNPAPSADDVLKTLEQDRLAEHLAGLPPADRRRLAEDLSRLDPEQLRPLRRRILNGDTAEHPEGECETLDSRRLGEDPDADARARERGEALLTEGKVAAFVVAGGQGTRLGHPGPKGTFRAGPISGRPLFEIFATRLRALGRRHGKTPPLCVMTSPGNHEETVAFFASHSHFGLDPAKVRFFSQGTMPAFSVEGDLVLADETTLFRSPDGHGGSFEALRRSGTLDALQEDGIEQLFYFQVDNPLVPICDPIFLGHHLETNSEFSSIVVAKRDPDEKVGVLARRGGKACVIEYSDLPDELRHAEDSEGRLLYRAGNVAIHAFPLDFLRRVTREGSGLPFHFASKKIPAWTPEGPREIQGVKLETFVFDALPLAREVLVLEAPRAEVFSPIKNAEGQDSPQTSRSDQIERHARWLEAAGVAVPRDANGACTHAVEISPLFADSADELAERRSDLPDRVEGDLLLDA